MQRLRQRHSKYLGQPATPEHAVRLFRQQSLRRGAMASTLALVGMMALGVSIAMLFDRHFPWYSILQGFVIGTVMRRYGCGVDWAFPALAAGLTAFGAVAGSFLNALFLTGREFGTGALALVDEISWHTIAAFLVKDFGVVELIYMVMAVAVAAFYAVRRLSRQESIALRRQRERARDQRTGH